MPASSWSSPVANPSNRTHTLASWAYLTTVTSGDVGQGAAIQMVLLVIVRVLAIALGWLFATWPTL